MVWLDNVLQFEVRYNNSLAVSEDTIDVSSMNTLVLNRFYMQEYFQVQVCNMKTVVDLNISSVHENLYLKVKEGQKMRSFSTSRGTMTIAGLEIFHVTQADGGTYSVKATNVLGEANANINLNFSSK